MSPEQQRRHTNRQLAIGLSALQIALFLVLCWLILQAPKTPFADDWSYVKPLQMNSLGQVLSWLISPYVDHRIPFQKLIHSTLALASGFDMRVLMFANACLALVCSIALVQLAYLYRGRHSFGDLAIPLIILSPASGYSMWAFHLTFLSSIVLVSLSVLHWCRFDSRAHENDFILASLYLGLLPLCGMNGAIFSTVMSTGLLAFLGVRCAIGKPTKRAFLLVLSLAVSSNLLVWLSWTPSSATTQAPTISDILASSWTLLGASTLALTTQQPALTSGLVLMLASAACIALVTRARSGDLHFSDLVLCLVILASLLTIAAVAIGRAQTEIPIFHYGYLIVLLPISSWIIISRSSRAWVEMLAASTLVALYATSYATNLNWRLDLLPSQARRSRELEEALHSERDTGAIIDRFGRELIGGNSRAVAKNRRKINDRLKLLRQRKYPLYKVNS